MSPKKPVENLCVLCTKFLIVITLDSIKSYGEKCVESLKEYFGKMPKNLQETILVDILELSALNSFSKWTSFCIFHGSGCAKFDSRSVSAKFHEKIAEMLENVVFLNLSHAQISQDTLKKLIKKCPNLRSLIIPNFASDDILKLVADLRHLELLDISGSVSMTRNGLKSLSSESLRILALGNNLKSSIISYENYNDILSIILPQLPNLTEIRNYDYTGRAFLELKKPLVTKLKAIADCETTIDQMKVIVSVCPDLEKISLEDPDPKVFELLEELAELRILKVVQFRGNLKNLKLNKLTLSNLVLEHISVDAKSLCLTLENLTLRSCRLNFNPLDHFGSNSFRNLVSVEFIDCNINKDFLMFLMEYCDRLQRLAMSNDVGLTDADVKSLCQKQRLKHLKELWLSLAKQLSSDSVIMLMNHCDKLTLLGTLNGWNIEKVEVNYLKCVIYLTNTNLSLLYFSCF